MTLEKGKNYQVTDMIYDFELNQSKAGKIYIKSIREKANNKAFSMNLQVM